MSRFNLNTVEGRVSALRASAPIVAELKDRALQPGYTRELARMLGLELGEVQRAVRSIGGSSSRRPGNDPRAGQARYDSQQFSEEPPLQRASLASLPATPSVRLERDALMAMLQQSAEVGVDLMAQAVTAEVGESSLKVVRDAIGATLDSMSEPGWFERVLAEAPEPYRDLIRELAIAPMPQNKPELLPLYARDVIASLLDRDLLSLKSELVARMQRIGDPTGTGSRQIQEQLAALESARRSLRAE